jgi:hypothetical protein
LICTRTKSFDENCSRSAKTVTANGDVIGVSAFSIAELVYATEKATNPISLDDLNAIKTVLGDRQVPFKLSRLMTRSPFVWLRFRVFPMQIPVTGSSWPAEVLGLPLVSSAGQFRFEDSEHDITHRDLVSVRRDPSAPIFASIGIALRADCICSH